MDRVEKLLALLVIKAFATGTTAEKAAALSAAGFSHQEISELVGTSPQVIRQSLYQARVTAKSRPRRRKK